MDTLLRELEQDLDELAAGLLESPELIEEHEADLKAFIGPLRNPAAIEAGTLRRHREWFLLERESEAIGGAIPLEAAFELRTTEDAGAAMRYAALRASRSGIFVVARLVPGDGFLLDELLGRGQYVVDDIELSTELEPGDLLVGRIFPRDIANEGERTTWCLSSGAANLRNPELLEAIERDVEAMRKRARGPLRMTQAELEVMFFNEVIAPEATEPVAVPDAVLPAPVEAKAPLAEQLTDLRELLVEGGFGDERWSEIVDVLRARPMPVADLAVGGDDPVGWILEELAFETDLDLADVRTRLLLLWRSLHDPHSGVESTHELTPAVRLDDEDGPSPEAIRAALERFDAARQAGGDVDALFAVLETELGLEVDADADDHLVPDFPGVLGALVQEYLWDGARLAEVDLDEFVAANRDLELFVQFGAFLGIAEELELRHLRVFLGRWLWEQVSVLSGERDLGAIGTALEAFLVWMGEHHGHSVGDGVEDLFEIFQAEQARVLQLNQSLAESVGDLVAAREPVTWEFLGGKCWLDQVGERIDCVLTVELGELAIGDFVVGQRTPIGFAPRLVLPPISGPHTNATS
ncbi:MAG: hypothetical protein P1V81_01710 [Planctomycetota bacterium]|nr:hypothetical protein [Planctomycetota bacterium]